MTPADLRALLERATDESTGPNWRVRDKPDNGESWGDVVTEHGPDGDWRIVAAGGPSCNHCEYVPIDADDAALVVALKNTSPHLVALWEAAEALTNSDNAQRAMYDAGFAYALDSRLRMALAALKAMP